MANYQGNSILTGIYTGLTNTYSQLAKLYPEGITKDNISKAQTDSTKNTTLNSTFASYLQNNFTNIDKDGDGKIGSDEIQNFTNMLSTKGITKAELTQLAASGASGLSTETLNNIMEHFNDMDTNHDGRITGSEITSFGYGASKQERVDEYAHQKATNMSTFYGDDSSSLSTDSYSMLSYKYKNNSKK